MMWASDRLPKPPCLEEITEGLSRQAICYGTVEAASRAIIARRTRVAVEAACRAVIVAAGGTGIPVAVATGGAVVERTLRAAAALVALRVTG